MRVLIFGGNGMLGHKLIQVLDPHFDVYSTVRCEISHLEKYGIFRPEKTIARVDVENFVTAYETLKAIEPEVVINAAGIIKQLPSSKDIVKTLSVNSLFPHRLAQAGREMGFRTITISTDCVFSGTKGNYSEDETPDALDLYGQSKHFGEVIDGSSLTLRTSIIGRELGSAHSLVNWFLSNRAKTVNGYTKAIYSGFPTIVFADIIKRLIGDRTEMQGLYHVSSEPISKYDLLNLINERWGLGITVEPEEEFMVDRSLDSSRFRAATGFAPEPWPAMIDAMCSDPTPYDRWNQ